MKTKYLSMLCAAAIACGSVGAIPAAADAAKVYVDQTFANGMADLFTRGHSAATQVLSESEIFSHDADAVWHDTFSDDGALKLANLGSGKTEAYAQIKLDAPWQTMSENVQIEFKMRLCPVNKSMFQFRPFTNETATAFGTEMVIVDRPAIKLMSMDSGKNWSSGDEWSRIVLKTDVEAKKFYAYVNGEYVGEADLQDMTVYGFRFSNVAWATYTDTTTEESDIWVDDLKIQSEAQTYLENSSKETVNHVASLDFNNEINADKLGTITVTDADCNVLSAEYYTASVNSIDNSVVDVKFAPSVSGVYTIDYSGIDGAVSGSTKVNVGKKSRIVYYLNEDFADGEKAIGHKQINNLNAGISADDVFSAAPDAVWSAYKANGALKAVTGGSTKTNKKESYYMFYLPNSYRTGTKAVLECKLKSEYWGNNQFQIRPSGVNNAKDTFGAVIFEISSNQVKLNQLGDSLTQVAYRTDVMDSEGWNMIRIEFFEDNTTKLYINGNYIAEGSVPNMPSINRLRLLNGRLKNSNLTDRVHYVDDLKFYTESDAMLLEGSNLDNTENVTKTVYLDFEDVPTEESLSNITVKQSGTAVGGAVVSAVKNSVDNTLVEVTLADNLSGSYELDYTGVESENGTKADGALSFSKRGYGEYKQYYSNTFANGLDGLDLMLNNSMMTKEEVYTIDTTSAPASAYDDGMLKIENKGNGTEAYAVARFDNQWNFADGDMQYEMKLKTDSLRYRNFAVQSVLSDGSIKGMILIDNLNVKLMDYGSQWSTYPIRDYADEWMHIVVKTEGENFTMWINNNRIGTGVIENYGSAAGMTGVRILDKVWNTTATKWAYIDEIKVQSVSGMRLENEDELSQDKESFVIDFNNTLNPYSINSVYVLCDEQALDTALYSLKADAVDKTRLLLTLDRYAPAGEYRIVYDVVDLDNSEAEGSVSFARVKEDYIGAMVLSDNGDGTATASVETIIYNGTASYALITAVYDEDEFTGERTLVDVKITEADNYSGQKTLTCKISAQEDQVVQALLWSGIGTMKPVQEVKWKTM